MTDLERLDEALEQSIFKPSYWPSETTEDYDERLHEWLLARDVERDAARKYRDLLANGERVTWCAMHFDTWTTAGWCRNGLAENEAHRCVKVSRLLVDPPKEEER